MAVLVLVVVAVAVVMVLMAGWGLGVVAPDKADTENACHHCRDEAYDGTDDRRDPSEEDVGYQNGIRARFRSRNQKRHA